MMPSVWFAACTPYTCLEGTMARRGALAGQAVDCMLAVEARRAGNGAERSGNGGTGFGMGRISAGMAARSGEKGESWCREGKKIEADKMIEGEKGGRARAGRRLETAGRLAAGIAADQMPWALRASAWLLSHVFKLLFGGEIYVDAAAVERARALQESHTLVWVPTHKTHADYMIVSYVLFSMGLTCPHIAAGDNLNLPYLGLFLRRLGAFFLRRTIRGSPDSDIYKGVLAGYVEALLTNGHPIEFFIEGGRTRDGHINKPKLGILGYVLAAFLDASLPKNGNVAIIPVDIACDRVLEEKSMISQLMGKPKPPESIWGMLSSLLKICLKPLRLWSGQTHFAGQGGLCGVATVSIGDPIYLGSFFKEYTQSRNNSHNTAGQAVDLHKALPWGSGERSCALESLGIAVHRRLLDCRIVPSSCLVASATLLIALRREAAGDTAGWISFSEVHEAGVWLEERAAAQGGRCMSLSGHRFQAKAMQRSMQATLSLMSLSAECQYAGDEPGIVLKPGAESMLAMYSRVTQLLPFIAPQCLVSCAMLWVLQGGSQRAGSPMASNITESSPAPPVYVKFYQCAAWCNREHVVQAALWLRALLAPELDLLLTESGLKTAESLSQVLDSMVAEGTVARWEPGCVQKEAMAGVVLNGSHSGVDSLVVCQNTGAEAVDDSVGAVWERADDVVGGDGEGAERSSGSGGLVPNLLWSMASDGTGSNSGEGSRDGSPRMCEAPALSYAHLLSPVVSTYVLAMGVVLEMLGDGSHASTSEKELSRAIQERLMSKVESGQARVVPSVTLIKRLLHSLLKDCTLDACHLSMPAPMLVRVFDTSNSPRPPLHQRSESVLSDMSSMFKFREEGEPTREQDGAASQEQPASEASKAQLQTKPKEPLWLMAACPDDVQSLLEQLSLFTVQRGTPFLELQQVGCNEAYARSPEPPRDGFH
eukprot:evm.model.scf_472.5 EVM.evm.TU.scf_472.5   scf_472:42381-46122(+)